MRSQRKGFIAGRKVSDNVIIVQEIIHSMTLSYSKVGYMTIKIDLDKAYDRLEWPFIRHTLQFFNFPKRWIDLIFPLRPFRCWSMENV